MISNVIIEKEKLFLARMQEIIYRQIELSGANNFLSI